MPDRLQNLTDRDLLIMNTEDTKSLFKLVEQIDTRFNILNGSVKETMIKLAKTEELAKATTLMADRAAIEAREAKTTAEACDKETNGRINGILWAVLGLAVTFIVTVIGFLIQKGLKV
jgi:uncharacterized protein YfkK (UPF0435 family)